MREMNAIRAGTELQTMVISISRSGQRAMSTLIARREFVRKWFYWSLSVRCRSVLHWHGLVVLQFRALPKIGYKVKLLRYRKHHTCLLEKRTSNIVIKRLEPDDRHDCKPKQYQHIFSLWITVFLPTYRNPQGKTDSSTTRCFSAICKFLGNNMGITGNAKPIQDIETRDGVVEGIMIDAISRSLNIPWFGEFHAGEKAARVGKYVPEQDPDHEVLNNQKGLKTTQFLLLFSRMIWKDVNIILNKSLSLISTRPAATTLEPLSQAHKSTNHPTIMPLPLPNPRESQLSINSMTGRNDQIPQDCQRTSQGNSSASVSPSINQYNVFIFPPSITAISVPRTSGSLPSGPKFQGSTPRLWFTETGPAALKTQPGYLSSRACTQAASTFACLWSSCRARKWSPGCVLILW